MAINKAARFCTHIKVNGVRCGSPALRGEHFCYFHQRMIRGVSTPPQSRLHPMAFLEDGASIQASLMEVINALVRNTIDLRRAQSSFAPSTSPPGTSAAPTSRCTRRAWSLKFPNIQRQPRGPSPPIPH
jgi:hypothetical protein